MNKKAILGNIISTFIAIFVGFSLVGTISQEVDNAFNCNLTNQTNFTYEKPLGSTDSFGGAYRK